jgi:phosphoribosyl 1,2-cyclic phosphodiesterase
MNCKPGDLAVIVRSSAFTKYIGSVVRCVATDGFMWQIDRSLDGHPEYWILVPDSCLRHIRDPGEDARDESLAWLPPVPNTTKETA